METKTRLWRTVKSAKKKLRNTKKTQQENEKEDKGRECVEKNFPYNHGE